MAKKGQAVQLQAEIQTDEEWEKLVKKDGLIVVDVYSDWCGPCQGMSANLKKLKLEIGGDMLQLAMAKTDNIAALERFRNKSEPTWMFISKGKMVNLMFGANAPKLTRMITDELKVEKQVNAGERQRDVTYEVTERSPEEQARYETAENARRAAQEKEAARRAKELHDRKVAECNNILHNLPGYGTILIFPSAKDLYQAVLVDMINEAGLAINQTEKVQITEEMFQDLMYFSEEENEGFNDDSIECLLSDKSIVLLIKNKFSVDDFDDIILRLVYGEMMKPPGDPECPYQLLNKEEDGEDEAEDVIELTGIWTPRNDNMRATCLKLFFPRQTSQYRLPEVEPTPPCMTLVFDDTKIPQVKPLMNQYKTEILNYGFFTSGDPEEAQLIAKSFKRLEDPKTKRTPDEKLVIKLAKRKSECMLAMVTAAPLYISPTVEEGERECDIFFPEDYAESLDEEDMDFEEPETVEEKELKADIDEMDDFLEGEMAEGGIRHEYEETDEDEEDEEEEEEEDEHGNIMDLFPMPPPEETVPMPNQEEPVPT